MFDKSSNTETNPKHAASSVMVMEFTTSHRATRHPSACEDAL